MFGFIKGLFGSSENAGAIENAPIVAQQSKDAFFLGRDEASTLGDVDYMRSTKSVKRTYAKTVDSPEEKVTIKQVSSMNSKVYEEGESFARPTFQAPTPQSSFAPTPAASTPAPAQPKVDEATERRKTDTSMDMFRNMAKDIRK
jgi:hypothetical protein